MTDSLLNDSGPRYFGELSLGDGRVKLDRSLRSRLPFQALMSSFTPNSGGVNVNVKVDTSTAASGAGSSGGDKSRSELLGVREDVAGIAVGTQLTIVADFCKEGRRLKATESSSRTTVVAAGGLDELVRARQSEASFRQMVSYGACAGAAIGLLALASSK